MSTEKNVLVLGGTVFLSEAIAKQAVARGHRVTIASRGTTGEPPEGTAFTRLDRSTGEGLDALRGKEFDAVFDVARVPGHIGPVLDALADSVGHWSLVSTISVYARNDIVSDELHEPTAPDSTDADWATYGASKVACETLVRERMGDRALITRPGLIVGPGDRNDRLGYWPLRFAEGGEILAPGTPDRRVQWIDVEDYAAWLLDCANLDSANPDRADAAVTGTIDAIGEPVPFGPFLDGIADALIKRGVLTERPNLTWVPQEFLAEHGVNPWAGPDSLGMWLPSPDYDGMQGRPGGPAVAAGFRASPLDVTVDRWWDANAAAPRLKAGLTREKESAVLAAWHGDPDRVPAYTVERRFTVPEAGNLKYEG